MFHHQFWSGGWRSGHVVLGIGPINRSRWSSMYESTRNTTLPVGAANRHCCHNAPLLVPNRVTTLEWDHPHWDSILRLKWTMTTQSRLCQQNFEIVTEAPVYHLVVIISSIIFSNWSGGDFGSTISVWHDVMFCSWMLVIVLNFAFNVIFGMFTTL